MEIERFWQLMETSHVPQDLDEQAEKIRELLSELPAAEVAGFDQTLRRLLNRAYSWDLWGAAYLVSGGCSDDGFEYFRSWLVAQGKDNYERALSNPDSLANIETLEEEVEFEELWHIAEEVYETKTGEQLPATSDQSDNFPELGKGWDFDDYDIMKQRYPNLYKRFVE